MPKRAGIAQVDCTSIRADVGSLYMANAFQRGKEFTYQYEALNFEAKSN